MSGSGASLIDRLMRDATCTERLHRSGEALRRCQGMRSVLQVVEGRRSESRSQTKMSCSCRDGFFGCRAPIHDSHEILAPLSQQQRRSRLLVLKTPLFLHSERSHTWPAVINPAGLQWVAWIWKCTIFFLASHCTLESAAGIEGDVWPSWHKCGSLGIILIYTLTHQWWEQTSLYRQTL